MQNADDAGATEFVVQSIGDSVIAANNGRAFTTADLEALCRSGASNKQRGTTTIGYRGIGFKSVINLAERVWVFSGGQHFVFDRNRTRQVLRIHHDVPLIRIPHIAELAENIEHAVGTWRRNYATVFLFESINSRLLREEIEAFDGGSLLFLRNLEKVTLCTPEGERLITKSSRTVNDRRFCMIADLSMLNEWELLYLGGDPLARVAVKFEDGQLAPASISQAVLYSFTPTTEYTGIPVRFNGDFTTDPSRKTVDLDSTSTTEFRKGCLALCDAICAALERRIARPGLFTALTNQAGYPFDHPQPCRRSEHHATLTGEASNPGACQRRCKNPHSSG